MTVTPIRTRARATRPQPEATPESQNVAKLRAMLEDPAQADNYDDIRAAIDYLTATSTLAA